MRNALLLSLLFLFACTNQLTFDEEEAREEILALENRQREVHLQKRAVELAAMLAPDHISVNRGRITEPSQAELEERFQGYFGQVEFLRWDDVEPPRIYFSDDGSIAYSILNKDVVVHFLDEAGMVQLRTPFAWSSIYRRYDGEWKIASVSSTNQESISDSLHNVVMIADCRGPEGSYRTEMHTTAQGYLFFRQDASYRDEIFEGVVFNDSVGYQVQTGDQLGEALSLEVINMLSSHNVFWMRLLPNRFFRNIERDSSGLTASAADVLGNPVTLHYDSSHYRLASVQLQNAMELSEDIEIYFDSFSESAFGDLPKTVRFIQAHRDTFFFDFTSVELNSATARLLENN